MLNKVIYNVKTGEWEERPLTKEEKALASIDETVNEFFDAVKILKEALSEIQTIQFPKTPEEADRRVVDPFTPFCDIYNTLTHNLIYNNQLDPKTKRIILDIIKHLIRMHEAICAYYDLESVIWEVYNEETRKILNKTKTRWDSLKLEVIQLLYKLITEESKNEQ